MHERVLNSLVYSIYRTLNQPDRWALILQECRNLVKADACDLCVYDFERSSGRILSHCGSYTEDFVETFRLDYAPLNPWLQQRSHYVMDGAISIGSETCPEGRLLRTGFYNEWLRPQGFCHQASILVLQDDTSIVYLSLLRRRERKDFEREEVAAIQALAPHLKQVLEMQWLLGTLITGRRSSLLDVSKYLNSAVVLVGARAQIVGLPFDDPAEDEDADERGTRPIWTRITAPLEVSDRRRPTPSAVADNSERSPQTQLEAEQPNEKSVTHTVGQRRNGRPTWRPLVIDRASANARDRLDSPNEYSSRGAGLGTGCRNVEDGLERLRALYELTPAESNVALLLAYGKSVQECTEMLGVSISTVRTHLQRVYAKTGTHHQGELVATLLMGPAQLSMMSPAHDQSKDRSASA